MTRIFLASWLLPLAASAAPCMEPAALMARDAQYEDAMRSGDAAFLDKVLADDFVWVHNLASSTDTRDALLKRVSANKTPFKSRTTSDVKAHALGDSVVLRGLSTVEQWNPDGKTWKSNRYQFMRTWVNVGGECKLLAVQTMKVWSSETK